MTQGLTQQQAKALQFIRAYFAENDGVAPSYADIMAHLNLRSRSNVSRLVKGLSKRGAIRHHPNLSRAIELVDASSTFALPADLAQRLQRYCTHCGESASAVVIDAVTLHLDQVESLREVFHAC